MKLTSGLGLLPNKIFGEDSLVQFSPSSISGLALWLDPSDATTVTESSGEVSRIDDKSGNSHYASQGTAGKYPLINSATINSLPVLNFDGTDDFLSFDSGIYSINTQDATVFVVMQDTNTSGTREIIYGKNFASTSYVRIRSALNTVQGYFGSNNNTNVRTGDKNNARVFMMTSDNEKLNVFSDGRPSYYVPNSNGVGNLTSLILGGDGSSSYFKGNIGEIIIYNRVLSVQERNSISSYLGTKWGIDVQPEYNSLRVATTFNAPQSYRFLDAARDRFAVRQPHIYARDMSSLILSFYSGYMTANGTGGLGNSYTVHECAIEGPSGDTVRAYFRGSPSKVIYDQDVDHQTDRIDISSLNLQEGDIFYIKVILGVDAVGLYFPASTYISATYTGAAQYIKYNSADTVLSDIMTAGDFTYTGVSPANVSTGFTPVVVGVNANTTQKSFIIMGDSIGIGDGDNGTGRTVPEAGKGFAQRTMAYGENFLPSVNFSITNTKATDVGAQWLWRCYSKYVDVAITELGTNDIGSSSSPVNSLSTIENTLSNIWSANTINGVSDIIYSKVLQRSTSTDSWATEANQTVLPLWVSGEVAEQLNDWADTKVADSTITAALDYSSMNAAIDPYKWSVDGTVGYSTTDGIHPSYNGADLMAGELRAVIDVL